MRVHRTLIFAPETQTFTLVNSEYFTFHLFLPYCGWQWCIQLNYNLRVFTSYDNLLTLKIPQEHMQLTLIIIASFLAVLQLKKTLTKFKSVTKQLILNMRLLAVLCLMWSLAIRVLAVPASSAPLQCIFSHGGIIHFFDVMLHPELVVCLYWIPYC